MKHHWNPELFDATITSIISFVTLDHTLNAANSA